MDDHRRVIVHIDINCFYAQVEMIKQPSLRYKPLGVQQKNIVVTSNYVARERGVEKCMPIGDAKRLCPDLVLVNGEDLYDYRHASNRVTELLKGYSEKVERLGLDENFVDVTDVVERDELLRDGRADLDPVGCTFGVGPNGSDAIACECGCASRLSVGTRVARRMRDEIFDRLQLTTCAGVAHNKLLAKLVGGKNKPNNQTVVFPNDARALMLGLDGAGVVPGIGKVGVDRLAAIGVRTVAELQNADPTALGAVFGANRARQLIDCAWGIDDTPVKSSGKPSSVGLEDAGKPMTDERAVEQKLRELLKRLLVLVKEDGRVPKVLKVTVGRVGRTMVRESRQGPVVHRVSADNEDQLIGVALGLFRKMCDAKGGFKVTLLGLAFSKFVDKPGSEATLAAFLAGNRRPSGEPPAAKRAKRDGSAECPPDVDADVFRQLPEDIRKELWDAHTDRARSRGARVAGKPKVNTILNYVVKRPNK